MRLLVLGGTNFVGRSVVGEALRRGDEVTTVNRGVSGEPPAGARRIQADRRDSRALEAALGADEWDAVIDTWAMEPVVVRESARLLAGRAGHYGYVSSRSVYCWPLPVGRDESAPVVNGDPESTGHADYAAAKRGGELAVLERFDGRALLARAGLILGPYEDVGRLPWWLGRISRGGRVLAPGPADRGLQYVDARDLARWMLDAAERGSSATSPTTRWPRALACPSRSVCSEARVTVGPAGSPVEEETAGTGEESATPEATERAAEFDVIRISA